MAERKPLLSDDYIETLCSEHDKYNNIDVDRYVRDNYRIKRGLRNSDGSGVVAGVTNICNVHGYVINENEKVPEEGKLIYRGIDINELVAGARADNRFGFEETEYLLLMGSLPTQKQLDDFRAAIDECRELPHGFIEDVLIKTPSRNIMNKLESAILNLYSYCPNPDDVSLETLLRQSIEIIARVPTIVSYAYQSKRRHYDNQSMYLHPIPKNLSTAECLLTFLRPDMHFTDEEATLLDVCLMLHAEHGGGNNSTFSCRVLSSSGTDTYSAISAAVGALKGFKHGGANLKIAEMMDCIKSGVSDWSDDGELLEFLKAILRREKGDGSGLIYGMGHAVYTLSDPRAVLLKKFASSLAEKKNMLDEFRLIEAVERLAPEAFADVKQNDKPICANVDMYSGFVYTMLNLPRELFTPIFATARIAGWCAHRIEEIALSNRIIRPAYLSVLKKAPYTPLSER
ncbi:MAG: citrate synthase [Clostridia bacterium]|nr:citrate synthase [Clostridia bacterium]